MEGALSVFLSLLSLKQINKVKHRSTLQGRNEKPGVELVLLSLALSMTLSLHSSSCSSWLPPPCVSLRLLQAAASGQKAFFSSDSFLVIFQNPSKLWYPLIQEFDFCKVPVAKMYLSVFFFYHSMTPRTA